jgi:isocitrate/isopropylmalate dehydrogenase
MLEHCDLPEEGQRMRAAVLKTVGDRRSRTRDLGGPLGTREFGQAVIANL